MSLLKFPKNGFQLIEDRILANPKMLNAGHYHTLPYGTEATTEEDIMKPYTAHCLFGWVVAVTPRAAAYERNREDVLEYANQILIDSGRLPIPMAIAFSDEESMRKVVRGRASEERALEFYDSAETIH
jgi:hypothetical protein